MKFIVDAQLPPALARFLCAQGHETAHVFDLGFNAVDDQIIWQHAQQTASIIITKDDDFMHRVLISHTKVPVVLIRIGNCSNRALFQWFGPLLPEVISRLASGEQLIELT